MKSHPASLRTRFTIPSLPAATAPVVFSGPIAPAGSRSTKFFIPAIMLFAGVVILTTAPSVRAANTPDNVTGTAANTPLDSAGSYNNGLPGTTSDVIFTNGTAYTGTFTLNTSPLSIGTLDDLNAIALTISASQALTLNGGTNAAAISPTATGSALLDRTNPADLLYVGPGGSLTLSGTGGVVLGAAGGNIDIASSNFSGTAANGVATINSVISDGGLGYGFSKTGVGTLVLTAANTYTGATNVVQGNLTLNFNAAGAPTANIISSSSALTLGGYTTSGGGSLYAPTLAGELPTLLATAKSNTTTSQTFNGLTVNAGNDQLIAQGNGTGSMTLALGAISVNSGGSVNFNRNTSGGTGVGIFTTSNVTDPSGLINGVGGAGVISSAAAANSAAFVVPTDYATVNGSGQIVPYTGYTALTAGGVTSNTNANYQVTATTATALTAPAGTTDLNTIAIKSTSTALTTLTIATGGTVRFGANGGILGAAANAAANNAAGLTITGGSITAGGSAVANNPGTINLELVNGPATISSNIVNNGTGAVTVVVDTYAVNGGTNTNTALTLTGTASTFTGGLFINSGRVAASSAAVGTGTITIGPAGQLNSSGGTFTNALVLEGSGGGNSGAFFDTPSALRGGTFSGTVTLAGDAGVQGNVSLTGQVTGPGGLEIGRPQSSGGTGGTYTLGNTSTTNLNNYQGNTLLTEGTLNLGANNVIPSANTLAADTGNVIFNAAPGNGNATLNLNGKSDAINGLSSDGLAAGATGAGIVTNSASGASVLTLGYNNATATFNGVVSDSGTGKTLAITKVGTGTQTFGGVDTYTGATTINNGTLAVATTGSIGASAVTVNSPGTLSVLGANGLTGTSSLTVSSGAAVTLSTSNNYSGATTLSGTLTLGSGAALTNSNVVVGTSGGVSGTLATGGASNTLSQTLTVNSGGTVNMVDGATTTLTVSGAANLYAGTAGTASAFKFDLSSTNNVSDVLAIGGAASATNAGGQIFLNALGALTVGNTYTVVTAASGLNTNGLTLGSNRVAFGGTAYSLSLVDTATTDTITVTGTGVPTLYWTGANSMSWSQTTPGTNFSTSASGTPDAGVLPNSLTDVNFAATGAPGGTTTLDAAFTINSLNFLANSAAYTIAPGSGGTLTINAGGLTDASANAQTITAPLTLGGQQTWSNTGTALLTASGSTINNGGFLQTLSTTSGGGNIAISDTISGAGGLATTGSGTATISGPVNITGPISTAGSGTTTISGSISGASTLTTSGSVNTNLTGANATFTGALAIGSTGSTSISALLATTGGLTQTAGTLTLSNTGNTFSGGLTIAGGTLRIDTLNNVSTNGELGNQTSVTLGSTGGNTGTLEYTGTTATPSSTMPFTLAAGGTGAFQIDNGATNLTLSGVISGGGTLLKTGTGTLTLSGINTYTTGTTINAGTVVALNAATNLGANVSTNTLNIGSAGVLRIVNTALNTQLAQTITGNGRIIADFSGNANNSTYVPSNAGGFAGTLEVLASTGQGKLALGSSTSLPGTTLQVDNGGTFYSNNSVSFGAINVLGTGNGETQGALRIQNNQTLQAPTITLLGNTTVGAQFGNLGVTGNKIINGVAGTSTLTFGTPNAGQGLVVPANIVDGTGGNGPLAVSAAYTSTAAGGNNLVLSGTNTYTGGLTVTPPTANTGTTTVNLLNNQNGATGSIFVSNAGIANNNQYNAILNIGATSQTAVTGATVAAANSITVGNVTTAGNNLGSATLNVVGATGFATTVTDNGSLIVGRGGVMNVGNLSTVNQSGALTVVGNGGFAANLNVNTGGALNYTGPSAISLSGGTSVGGVGALTIAGGTLTTSQPINYASTSVAAGQVTLNAGGTLAISQNIAQLTTTTGTGPAVFQLGTGGGIIDTSTFNTALSTPVTNVSGQTGSLTKNGSGSLTLSGANTYTGTTTVNVGAMLVNGSVGAAGTPAGAVAVNNTGTLGGAGMLTVASATVAAGGTLAPGAIIGATTGALTLNTTSGVTINGTLTIGLGGAATGTVTNINNGTSQGTYLTYTSGGALTLGVNSVLNVNVPGGTTNSSAYDIADYSSLSGTFSSASIPSGYMLNYMGTSFVTSGDDIELDPITAVPEPSTWLFGVLTTAAVGFQVRRRKARNA